MFNAKFSELLRKLCHSFVPLLNSKFLHTPRLFYFNWFRVLYPYLNPLWSLLPSLDSVCCIPLPREHPSSFCPLLSEQLSCFAYPCPEPVLFRNRLIPFFHPNVEWSRFVCESWDQKLVVCFYLNKICFLKKIIWRCSKISPETFFTFFYFRKD